MNTEQRSPLLYESIPITPTAGGTVQIPGHQLDAEKEYYHRKGWRITPDFLARQTTDDLQWIVERGWCTAGYALQVEQDHKQRKGLLSWLEDARRRELFQPIFDEEFFTYVETHDLPMDDLILLRDMPPDQRQAIIEYMLYPRDLDSAEDIQTLFHTVVTTQAERSAA